MQIQRIQNGGRSSDLSLEFPTTGAVFFRVIVIGLALVVLGLLVSALLNKRESDITATTIFLLVMLLVLAMILLIDRKCADVVVLGKENISIQRHGHLIDIQWRELKKVKYLLFYSGFAHFWFTYTSSASPRTIYVALFTYEWRSGRSSKLELLLTELSSKTEVTEILSLLSRRI